MTPNARKGGADAIRAVLAFTFHHWRRQGRLATAITLAMLVSTFADVLVPVFAGWLVDAVAMGAGNEAARNAVIFAFGAIVGVALVTMLLRHLAFLGITVMTSRMMVDIAREAFWRVQRFSTDWQANNFAGSTVRKISRGMWALDILNDTALIALLPSAAVLIGSSVLLWIHWPTVGAIVALGSIACIAVTVLLSLNYVAPAARISNAWDTRIGGALADAVSCNAVVKSFGAEDREDRLLAGVLARWARRTRRTWVRGTNSGTVQAGMLLALRAGVIGAALVLWWQGSATPGDVAYVLTTSFVMQGYLREIGNQIRNLQRSVNDMEELVQFHAQPLGVADLDDARDIVIRDGEIRFDHVGFLYGNHATPLYRDLNVTIGAGEKVGLVGHSGSGKTTFVKLVQRLYDITEGRVLIDGQDVRHATQASLRSQIAIVQQDPILFHRSLAENIAYGRPGATQSEIEAAARLANADAFIERLPEGYRTLVGERGVKLSGGERQRVALARAFLADAPILILDEATSSLDSESEALIQQAIERLMIGRTAIVIAHRLSTVQAMDRILVFETGRVVEEGTHLQLVHRDNGIYRRLFERQALGMTRGLVA
jgi:ATP-binding cassette subfamily B protein